MSAWSSRHGDIVARAIDHEMKRLGIPCVYLTLATSQPPNLSIRTSQPSTPNASEYGFDMTQEPLPVVPAAHYTCGGVMTDLQAVLTWRGQHAIGEAAFTGSHGA
ncbi:MAG: FAD-binding protein [Candidatus Competibacteraceae bacterium]